MKKKKKLKIAFLSFYSGEVSRGVETYVHELSNRLVDIGHEVTVYQAGRNIQKQSKYKSEIFDVKMDWDKAGKYLGGLYEIYKVAYHALKALSKMSNYYDIVVPTNGRLSSIIVKLWSRNKKIKIVIPGQSGSGIDDRINLLTSPNVFVALTKHQLEWAKKIRPKVKCVVIPNGVDLDLFKSKKKIQIDLPAPVILNVGALVDFKRQDLLIKAVSKLPHASLLLVGKGRNKERLEKLGEKTLPGRFKIMSFKHSDVPDVYNMADLFTYPTDPSESFGIVLVEAMATGLAVVATDDPIRREIVGDAGIFVDPTDTKAYAEALRKALEIDWGAKPRRQAEKFSWGEIAKSYDKLFLDIVD